MRKRRGPWRGLKPSCEKPSRAARDDRCISPAPLRRDLVRPPLSCAVVACNQNRRGPSGRLLAATREDFDLPRAGQRGAPRQRLPSADERVLSPMRRLGGLDLSVDHQSQRRRRPMLRGRLPAVRQVPCQFRKHRHPGTQGPDLAVSRPSTAATRPLTTNKATPVWLVVQLKYWCRCRRFGRLPPAADPR